VASLQKKAPPRLTSAGITSQIVLQDVVDGFTLQVADIDRQHFHQDRGSGR